MYESPAVIDLFNQLNIPLPYPGGQYYSRRTCDGLISASDSGYEKREAIWWYSLHWDDDRLVPNTKITSFNARNLDGRMWRKPANERRALVLATEIGETERGTHYLMKARTPFAIGALYQDYDTSDGVVRSFALLTRPATPEFSKYHQKAMPLLLPLDKDVIETWLDRGKTAEDKQIKELLENPRVVTDLEVIPVKTFKRAEAKGPAEMLKKYGQ